MRILVTTAGVEPYHEVQRDYFKALAAADTVREHELVDGVLQAEAVLFVDLHQHPGDTFLRVLRRHPLVRRYPEKVYVYDERDRPFVSFPGIYVSGTPRLARWHPIVGGPYPALPTTMPPDARVPDVLFSFSGARTHPVRQTVLALEHSRCILRDTTAINFFAWLDDAAGDRRDVARSEYATTVARSKFVLCPRGHGPSSFRLYETLSAGRVPVVISDDWLAPPLIDWETCAVRVPEREAGRVPALLEGLESRWPQMAAAAASTFDEHFAPSRLWHHYATSLAALDPARRRMPWWADRQMVRLNARRVRSAAARLWP